MSARNGLIALATHGMVSAVLPACRLESGAIERFGSEAIGDHFRRAPMALEGARIVELSGQITLVAGSEALFADTYDGHLGRLWRVGAPASDPGEPAVAVAFDPDLRQQRGDIFLDPRVHPTLAEDAVELVRATGAALAHDPTSADFRTRAFVVRAFGNPARGAALFALHSLAAPVRTARLAHAVALWEDGKTAVVRDPNQPRDLRTRIVR